MTRRRVIESVAGAALSAVAVAFLVPWLGVAIALTNHREVDWNAIVGTAMFWAPFVAALTGFGIATFPRNDG